jgi:hypothetical protein
MIKVNSPKRKESNLSSGALDGIWTRDLQLTRLPL